MRPHPPSKSMPCSVCGRPMWRGSTSLPEGQATCHPCRRQLSPQRPKPKRFTPEVRTCPKCGNRFDAHNAQHIYCSRRCRPHYSAGKKWQTASERGYDTEHRKARAKYKREVVDKGNAYCHFCGGWVDPSQPWHYDHTVDRTGYRGATHPSCNTSDGAKRRTNRITWAQLPTLTKQCPTCGTVFQTIYPRQTYCTKTCRPAKAKAQPKQPKPPSYCTMCGKPVRAGSKACSGCRAEYNRTAARNYYRDRHGIPHDRPRYKRG